MIRRTDWHSEFIGGVCYCPVTHSRHSVEDDDASYHKMRTDGYTCPGCGEHVPQYTDTDTAPGYATGGVVPKGKPVMLHEEQVLPRKP